MDGREDFIELRDLRIPVERARLQAGCTRTPAANRVGGSR